MNAPRRVGEEVFAGLLANAVHDIKNALDLVLNAAEHIAETVPVPREGHQALQILQHHSRRASSDLVSLLGLYRHERGQALVQPRVVDCDELLAEIAAFNEPLLASRGIAIEVEACEAVEGFFDRTQVASVLNAAVNNTFRYAEHRVLLSCRVREGFTVFTIADDGPGFPPAVLARGAQAPVEAGAASGSTGLGLYFAQLIAELHRHRDRCGRVEIENLPGACFRLFLP